MRVLLLIIGANFSTVVILALWRQFSSTSLIADQILLLGLINALLVSVFFLKSRSRLTSIGSGREECIQLLTSVRAAVSILLAVSVFFSVLVIPVQTIVNVDRISFFIHI